MNMKFIQDIFDTIRGKHMKKLRKEIITLEQMVQKKLYSGGQRWELELEKRLHNPLYLEGYGYKVFSQNDEDGIIDEIFHRIGTTNKRFIEFGVQDGMESNAHLLLLTGWSGLWIEGSSQYCSYIREKFKTSLEKKKLSLLNAFITRENINSLFVDAGFSDEIDFLSVDIDGNDWHILQAILQGKKISPRVICVEYNALIPPAHDLDDESTDWIMEYVEDWQWKGDDCQGASLSAFYHLGKKYGYTLVGTSLQGVNAFFVRDDLVQDKFVDINAGGG